MHLSMSASTCACACMCMKLLVGARTRGLRVLFAPRSKGELQQAVRKKKTFQKNRIIYLIHLEMQRGKLKSFESTYVL